MIHLNDGIDKMCFPKVFSSSYAVVDGAALKVALFVLENGECDIAKIAAYMNMPFEVAERSVEFWKTHGLLSESDSVVSPVSSDSTEVQISSENKVSVTPLTGAMEKSALYKKGFYDPAMDTLSQETQMLMGRTLSRNESRLLLEIFQETNLDVPILLIVISYWCSKEKNTAKILGRTQNTARRMLQEGLTTLSSAEEYISKLEKRETYYSDVAKEMHISVEDLTSSNKTAINKWYEDMGYDADFVAEVIMRKPDADFKYITAVFKNWRKKGYTTISQTRDYALNIKADLPKSKNDGSMIMDAIEELMSEE